MMYGWNGWGWGIAWMIVSWVVIIALVWAAFRAFTRDGHRREPSRSATDILAERFARGEIDADEYGERLRVLEERDTASRKR